MVKEVILGIGITFFVIYFAMLNKWIIIKYIPQNRKGIKFVYG